MSRAEYMKINSKYFPPDIRHRYEIEKLIAVDRYVYIKIIKGMYGLNKAAIISTRLLSSALHNWTLGKKYQCG